MKRMMTIATVAVGLVALLTVGCGGSSDDETTPTDGDTNAPMPDTNTPADTSTTVADTTVAPPQQDTTTLPPPMDTGAPPTTASTCADGLACLNACPPNDQGCQAQCIAQLGGEEAQKLKANLQCQQTAAGGACAGVPQEELTNCVIFEQCWDVVYACAIGYPTGEGTCGEFTTCLQGCGAANEDCQIACYGGASLEAIKLSLLIDFCLIDAGCVDAANQIDQVCLQTALSPGGACVGAVQACDADGAGSNNGPPSLPGEQMPMEFMWMFPQM